MRIDILTLFPEMFEGVLNESIIARAINKEKVKINLINFRDFSTLSNNSVDDTPYGGGAGMVLRMEPLVSALRSVKDEDSYTILLSPDGLVYNEKKAFSLKDKKHLILICGHYEGFDERIYNYVDDVISIGDFILTGGEIPAMVIIDSVVRLIDGVINEESYINDSFTNGLLDYPNYTKPRVFEGLEVPEVLVSGDHKKIEEYRMLMAKEKTERRNRKINGE